MSSPAQFSLELCLETLRRLMSPLGNLLTTNEPPSDAQIIHIRTCLAEIDAGLSFVNRTIPTLTEMEEGTLDALNEHQRYFIGARRQCNGIISHIRTLPPELLGHIFLHVVRFHFSDHDATSLSQVCARWRAAAFEDSALWTPIRVKVEQWFQSTTSLRKRLVQTLQRSGTHPLQIQVAVNKYWLRHEPQTCRHLLAPLFEQVHRWQTVKLYLPHMEEIGSLVYTGRGEAPLLETLDLHFPHNAGNDPVVIFRNSPRLRNLSAGGGKCILDIPWEQLETLTLHQLRCHAAMKEYLDVLTRYKYLSLRRLTVEAQYHFRPEYGPMPPADVVLRCPDLIYLSCEVPYFTKHLVAPRLKTAIIENDCKEPADFRCFIPLLERSNCYSTLTHFKYSKSQLASQANQFEILDALHQLVNLEYLNFKSWSDRSEGEEAFGALRYDLEAMELIASLGDAEGFLPRLRYFFLEAAQHGAKGHFPYFGLEGDMVGAFERRWHKRDGRLEEVLIVLRCDSLNETFSRSRLAEPSQVSSAFLTDDEEARMEALQKEGLKTWFEISVEGEVRFQFGDRKLRYGQYRYN